MKYWDAAKLKRVRKKRERAEQKSYDDYVAERTMSRTFTLGDARKNAELMLDALGSTVRRRMIERLAREGAMSLSKLSEPLGLSLTAAQAQLAILERVHLVSTHKQGRVRICTYNYGAMLELVNWLKGLGRIA